MNAIEYTMEAGLLASYGVNRFDKTRDARIAEALVNEAIDLASSITE